MEALRAYKYYIAMKLHFTKDDFNVFQNRGRINCPRETFEQRNDRFIFDKLAKKHSNDRELIQFYAANFIYGNENVVYSIEEAEEKFFEWNRRKESITKIFSDDCNKIILDAQSNNVKKDCIFNFTLNDYPSIIKLLLGGKISIESLRIFEDLQPFLLNLNKSSLSTLMFDKELRRIRKAKGFITYDLSKIKPIYENFKQELLELN